MNPLTPFDLRSARLRLADLSKSFGALITNSWPSWTGQKITLCSSANQSATEQLTEILQTTGEDRNQPNRGLRITCDNSIYFSVVLPGRSRAERQSENFKDNFSIVTPFKIDEVAFATGFVEPNIFQVRYLPHKMIAAWQEIANKHHHSIESISFDTPKFIVRLQKPSDAESGPKEWLSRDRILACLGLALIVNAVFFHLKIADVEQLEVDLAVEMQSVRREIAELAAHRKVIAEQLILLGAKQNDLINHEIQRLPVLLPPDSYITGFDIDAHRVIVRANMSEPIVRTETPSMDNGLRFAGAKTLQSISGGRIEQELLFERRKPKP